MGDFNSGIPKGDNNYRTLDIAGQSVSHHAIDRTMSPDAFGHEEDLANKLVIQFRNHGLLTASRDKQTPLHWAARRAL